MNGFENLNVYVGFEILTAVSVKSMVLWAVVLCSLVEVYCHFAGTSVDSCWTT
jgi:hypothetical protein